MKIAYVAVWDLFTGSAAAQKISDQLDALRTLGHDARAFFITGSGASSTPLIADAEFELESKRHGPVVKFVQRPLALRRLATKMREFAPDFLYVRQCAYFPGLSSTLASVAPYCVEINSDELAEMRLDRPRPIFEFIRLTRGRLLRRAGLLVCVTEEIARIERARYDVPMLVVGNGIRTSRVPFAPRAASSAELTIGFVGTPRNFWHGADKLVQLAALPELAHVRFVIAGPGPAELGANVPDNVTTLGFLGPAELDDCSSRFDVAISTAALHRKAMREASALKTRYYLARGIPTILPYRDPDLRGDEPFVLSINNDESNLLDHAAAILRFGERVKGDPALRQQARSFAEAHLDYAPKMGKVLAAMPPTAAPRTHASTRRSKSDATGET